MVAVSSCRFTGIALAVVLGAFALAADAQVYKCKDSSGKTIYSGAPCEYGGKPLDISDNVIQGERAKPEGYESAPSYGGSGTSAECSQLQRQAMEQASKPPSRGIADSYRQRQNVDQALSAYEAMCGADSTTREEPKPSTNPKRETASGFNPYAGQPSTRCPDGSYVRGSFCQICPDGSYVTGGSGCQITPKGTFVQGGKTATMCPDGSFVAGKCTLGPDGKFFGK